MFKVKNEDTRTTPMSAGIDVNLSQIIMSYWQNNDPKKIKV